ncbi:MAG TPA: DUF3971 domain-containing protein [Methylocystis sp.]|nr:DUF3971 domain-containing protein [Methylocystis sp.]
MTRDEIAAANADRAPTRLCVRTHRLGPCLLVLFGLCLRLSVGLITLTVFAIGVLVLALSRGPIDLEPLAPLIVRSLDEAYAPRYAFGLKSVQLAGSDRGPTLSVESLTVSADRRVIVAAPRAELSLDLTSLALGRIKPRRLEMLDLELRLELMPEGLVVLSAGGAGQDRAPIKFPTPSGDAVDAPKLLQRGGAAARALLDLATSPESVIGAIDRVGVAHGRLLIDDRAAGRQIAYEDLSLSLDKSATGAKLSLAASGPERRFAVVATAEGSPGARRIFEARAQGFSLDEISLLAGVRSLPFDADTPLGAEVRLALSEAGRVVEASASAHAGPGFFRLSEPDHEPVMIDTLTASVAWDNHKRLFSISPVRIKTGALDFTIEGELTPPEANPEAEAQPVLEGDWRCSLRLKKPGVVGPERAGQKPLRIDRASLTSRLSLANKRIEIEGFDVASPQLFATGAFTADFSPDLHIAFDLTLDNAQGEAIARLIPTHIIAPVRNWMFEHLRSGVIRHGVFSARHSWAEIVAMRYELPPPDESIHGEGDFSDAVLTGLVNGLPPVSGLAGHMRLSGRSFAIENATGSLETPSERRVALSEGRFVIDDTALKPSIGALDFKFSGGAENVSEILSAPGLSAFVSAPIDPARVKGQVEGRVHAQIEVGDDSRPDHTVAAVEANATGLTIERFLGAERLENGALSVQNERAGLRVSGTARILGAPATIELRRGADEKTPAQAVLSLTLDDAARAKAGWGTPSVTGPILAQIKTAMPASDADAQVELDLTRAALDNFVPGVVKPAGKTAKASFTLVRRPDSILLEHFMLDAGVAQLAGSLELSREGVFRSAKLSQVKMSAGDDLKLDAQRSGDALKLTARGSNFDVRPILRMLFANPGESAPPTAGKAPAAFEDVDLDFKSSLVTGSNKQILSNVELKWERRGGRSRSFVLAGNFGKEPLAATTSGQGVETIKIACGDGGALFSFLDLYNRMESGALTATIALGQSRSEGELSIHDFYLKGEPAMRQLMTQGAHRMDDKGSWRFDPESVRVARLESGFEWARGRLSLASGILSGPEVGLTFNGFVDFPRDRIDVSGAYVPLYGLNNLVGGVPLFGEIFAGGSHEGVLALNYEVNGPLSAPIVNVKPLSLFTPGMLRKIMAIFDGTARPQEQGR